MLKVTSQQLMDAVGTGIDEVGRPYYAGSVKQGDILTTTREIVQDVPKGFVLLATRFSVATGGAAALTGNAGTNKDAAQASPSIGSGGSAGAVAMQLQPSFGVNGGTLQFHRFARFNNLFVDAGSPDWRNAVPADLANWEPKYPVVIPSGWSVRPQQQGYSGYSEWAGGQAVQGLLVSEDDARALGFAVSGSSTQAERTQLVSSSVGTGASQVLVSGRDGRAIRIMDIQLRMQARSNTTTTVELRQSTGSRTIMKFVSSNPAELIDKQISPDIFLRDGADLELVTNVAGSCSVNVSYEFVEPDEVPGDHFWACQTPDMPTPGTGTTGLFSVFCTASSDITLYYPRLDSLGLTATKTAAGTGRQHFLRGYVVSAQKDGSLTGTSDTLDQQLFAISTAENGEDQISFRHTGVYADVAGNVDETGGSQSISPVMPLTGHDQTLTECASGLNSPAAENGVIRVDTVNMADVPSTLNVGSLATPTNGNMTEWYVSVWGRTAPTTFIQVRRGS